MAEERAYITPQTLHRLRFGFSTARNSVKLTKPTRAYQDCSGRHARTGHVAGCVRGHRPRRGCIGPRVTLRAQNTMAYQTTAMG